MALAEALLAAMSAPQLAASLARHELVCVHNVSVNDKDLVGNKEIIQEVVKHYPDSVPRASDLAKVFTAIDGIYDHKMCHHQHLSVDMQVLGALRR